MSEQVIIILKTMLTKTMDVEINSVAGHNGCMKGDSIIINCQIVQYRQYMISVFKQKKNRNYDIGYSRAWEGVGCLHKSLHTP